MAPQNSETNVNREYTIEDANNSSDRAGHSNGRLGGKKNTGTAVMYEGSTARGEVYWE
jgi:hypothetical protein